MPFFICHKRPRPALHLGFTLVELSVILVIIGLLAGGIVIGKDMVHASEIRSQIRQLETYENAVSVFETKYNCLPGDCDHFTQYFSVDAANNPVINGNGDGLIENNRGMYIPGEVSPYYGGGTSYDCMITDPPCPYWDVSTEMQQFFIQLSLAKLVPGTFTATLPNVMAAIGTSFPPLVLNPNASFFAADTTSFKAKRTAEIAGLGPQPYDMANLRVGKNALWMVVCTFYSTYGGASGPGSLTDNIHEWDDNCGIFLPSDLFAIDSKMDDGNPQSGNFWGFGGDGYGTTNGTSTSCIITNDGGNTYQYDFTQTVPQCDAALVFN